MKRKKSKFWLFWFSLIPGAGEMYLGFMQMGISLMGIFLGICFLASFLALGPLLFFNIIVWFYGFFHAHNLSNMPDEEFYAMKDHYLFNVEQFKIKDFSGRTRTFVAWALIAIGVLWIFNNSINALEYLLPSGLYEFFWNVKSFGIQLLVGVGIIFVGLQLIRGKSENIGESHDS